MKWIHPVLPQISAGLRPIPLRWTHHPHSARPARLCARIARAVSGVSTSASAIRMGRHAPQSTLPVPAQLAKGIISPIHSAVDFIAGIPLFGSLFHLPQPRVSRGVPAALEHRRPQQGQRGADRGEVGPDAGGEGGDHATACFQNAPQVSRCGLPGRQLRR